jgi:hypothetical protein
VVFAVSVVAKAVVAVMAVVPLGGKKQWWPSVGMRRW